MTKADDILKMLHDGPDMVDRGFLVQCIADGDGSLSLESRVEAVLAELLSSGVVEIGETTEIRPGASEFVAWRGTVQERIRRTRDVASATVGHDQDFVYWLCLRENVDRYE